MPRWLEAKIDRISYRRTSALTVVLSVVVSTLISSIATYYVATWTSANYRRLDARDVQILALFDSMVQFQTFAAAFASEISESKKVTLDTRQNLIQNLNEQLTRAPAMDNILPKEKKRLAADYRNAILKMLESARTTDDITQMQNFWSNASRVLLARNRLSDTLGEI